MDILFSASILAAFIGGMVALFAPCCITVLLPAYLASAFREKKNIIKMTFVFFGGIAVVLIPIGLGAAGLARVFQNFHKEMYVAGGILMIILGIMSILGKGFSLIPMPARAKIDPAHSKSVFLLGIFSGAATSCCAPVLAGAVTLAVVSGAFYKALIVTFAYVFGMVFPLFLAAYFYDRFHLEELSFVKSKNWLISIGSKKFLVHSTNLVGGIVFFAVGGALLWLGFSNNAFWAPAFQGKISQALNSWSTNFLGSLGTVPTIILSLLVLSSVILFAYKATKK